MVFDGITTFFLPYFIGIAISILYKKRVCKIKFADPKGLFYNYVYHFARNENFLDDGLAFKLFCDSFVRFRRRECFVFADGRRKTENRFEFAVYLDGNINLVFDGFRFVVFRPFRSCDNVFKSRSFPDFLGEVGRERI